MLLVQKKHFVLFTGTLCLGHRGFATWQQRHCVLATETLYLGSRDILSWQQRHCCLGNRDIASWQQRHCVLATETQCLGARARETLNHHFHRLVCSVFDDSGAIFLVSRCSITTESFRQIRDINFFWSREGGRYFGSHDRWWKTLFGPLPCFNFGGKK